MRGVRDEGLALRLRTNCSTSVGAAIGEMVIIFTSPMSKDEESDHEMERTNRDQPCGAHRKTGHPEYAPVGVLAPNAGLRAAVVPGTAESEPADEHAHGAPARMGWARLLKSVFDLDLEHSPKCGGEFKIIAAIEEPAVIAKILTHLGLPARAPPRSPARPLPLFQAA